MWRTLIAFFVGVTAAPYVKTYLKPVLREAVKKSVVAGIQLQKLAAETKEDLEDWAAEAAAEVTSVEQKPH